TLNCGSSSVKYSLWEMPDAELILVGIVERVAIGGSFLRYRRGGQEEVRLDHECPGHDVALRLIFDQLTHPEHGVLGALTEVGAVAHRVVHGGERFTQSVSIDGSVLQAIEDHIPLAPLHNPNNLAGI